jgi:hypothetical protein
MIENIAEMDPELFVGKPPKFVRPPEEWLDAVSPETSAAIDALEAAAVALETVNADIDAAHAHVVSCADVLRAAEAYERARGGPMTQTQLAKSFIASQRVR